MLIDRALVIAELAQHLTGMLADPRRRPANNGLIAVEIAPPASAAVPGRPRLVELGNEAARHHLLVVDDLAAAQDRRTRHVGRIKPLQPFGGGVLRRYIPPSC